jgi:8-oxo-dGTP pyrophosphatase MutT (NUDIX family)
LIDLRHRILGHMAAFERRTLDGAHLRRAAVAILLSPVGGEPTFALTRRALTLRRGAGNFALPGGNTDPGETPEVTARRETWEELGVPQEIGEPLGLLDDFVTLGGHLVTPVILWTDQELELRPNPSEVDKAWKVPLSDLDHPEAPRREPHPDGGEAILRMFAAANWVNPPTAAWLYQFREVALRGNPVRVDTVGQPNWTAR